MTHDDDNEMIAPEGENEEMTPGEQFTMLLYLMQIGYPDWANGDIMQVFARLFNVTISEAYAAAMEAESFGFVDHHDDGRNN